MNQDESRTDRPLDGAGGGMGDGGDPASAGGEAIGPGVQKELKEGGLGQALAGVTGQPGLSKVDEQAKSQAGAETPAKE